MKLNIEQLQELDHFIKYNFKDGGNHDKKALWRLYCNCQSFEATQTLKEFIIDHPYGYSTNGDVISHVQSFSLSLYTVGTIGRFACIWDPPKMTPLELHINFGNHLFANKDADAKNFSLAALNVNYKNSSFDAYDMFVMRALKDSWAFNKNPLLHYLVDSYYPNRKDIPGMLKIRTIGLLFILADLANGFEGIYILLVKLLISKYSRHLASYAYASKIMIDIFKIYDLVYRFSLYRATTKGQDNFLL